MSRVSLIGMLDFGAYVINAQMSIGERPVGLVDFKNVHKLSMQTLPAAEDSVADLQSGAVRYACGVRANYSGEWQTIDVKEWTPPEDIYLQNKKETGIALNKIEAGTNVTTNVLTHNGKSTYYYIFKRKCL